MIISNNPKFILLSLNKTGTSSMDDALNQYFDEALLRERLLKKPQLRFSFYGSHKRLKNKIKKYSWNDIHSLKHSNALWVYENFKYLEPSDNWQEYYKCCFVRNPFDRLLSVYSFHTQKIPDKFPKAVAAGDFKTWLKMGGTGSAKRSMKKFISDEKGNVLIDFVGRYETLDKDWGTITKSLGLEHVKLGVNTFTKTKHKNWQELYTQELKDIVLSNSTWREDLEYFGYI